MRVQFDRTTTPAKRCSHTARDAWRTNAQAAGGHLRPSGFVD